jgi:multidrug efflux pump subunit AcrA (membrane-fusion protein)
MIPEVREESKMKINFRNIAIFLVVVLGLIYIVTNIRRSSPEKIPAQPPVLPLSPARVYGQIEPEGGNVYVTAPRTRQIIAIHVEEGDLVEAGQKLCTLENSVEKAQALASLAKVELAKKSWAISKDEFQRNKALYDSNSISEYEFTHSKFKAELDSLNLLAAIKDAELAQAQLDQLDLKSPIDGVVYKFDLRLGESLPEGDNSFIILGKPSFWVRLYVESFWLDRIKIGDEYQVRDSETNEVLGKGRVISKAPYLGGKVFRTNDPYERFDIKYQEVILQLHPEKENIPIGLSVLAEIQPKEEGK